jgi:branched-chain amino acid transport system ATP-binding protein
MTQLRAEGVTTGYAKVEVLHGVSVEAGDGQVTCIFGPNGCGKSTLLKAIARSRQERNERIDELLDEFPRLRDRLSIHAANLSGGEQMMLAIARALIVRPRFLLFDEPSAGLSPKLATEALERVAALAQRGVGVLMVEQNIREAMRVADRIYVLVGGINRFEGRPADLGDDRELMRLYLGAPD